MEILLKAENTFHSSDPFEVYVFQAEGTLNNRMWRDAPQNALPPLCQACGKHLATNTDYPYFFCKQCLEVYEGYTHEFVGKVKHVETPYGAVCPLWDDVAWEDRIECGMCTRNVNWISAQRNCKTCSAYFQSTRSEWEGRISSSLRSGSSGTLSRYHAVQLSEAGVGAAPLGVAPALGGGRGGGEGG